MITAIARWQTAKLLLFIVATFVFSGFASGDDLDHDVQQRSSLQAAEVDLIKAQLNLETWKQSQLEDLYRDGFASWLEVRRHQLTVDSIGVRLEAAREFQMFLSAVESQYELLDRAGTSAYRPRESRPIKVFLPGSIRIIGWVEGQSLVEATEIGSNEAEIKTAQEKFAKAQRRYDVVATLPAATSTARENALLRLNLARQELKHLEAMQDFNISPAAATPSAFSLEEVENWVTAEETSELKSATMTVAAAEAAAGGYIKSAQIRLARERRRADAIRDWHVQGHATEGELKVVDGRVAELTSQLEAYETNQRTLEAAQERLGDADWSTTTATYKSVSTWPVEVFGDEEFLFHLVDLRRTFCKEQSLAEMNRLNSEMLSEVLARLLSAAAKTESNGEADSALSRGQRNEIESYRSDIEFAIANRLASIEKQQILTLEEKRFAQQAIAMHDAARNEVVSAQRQPLSPLAWSRLLHPAGAIASGGTTRPLAHFSYLESGNLISSGKTSSLLFSQADLQFIGSPFSGLDCQYSLLPVDTSLMTSYAGRSYSSRSGLQIEPDWMNYFRKNLKRNSVSTYEFPQLWTNRYKQNCSRPFGDYFAYPSRPFGDYFAYPNGILRSDLRSRITPGQTPWYLPGSPSNIRADQLKDGQGASFRRWSSHH